MWCRTALLGALVVLTTAAAPAHATRSWSPIAPVLPLPATDDVAGPDVGVTPDGAGVVTWLQRDDPESAARWRVRAARIAPGGLAGAALPDVSPVGARSGNTGLGVSRGGAAVAAWTQAPSGTIQSARLGAGAQAFGPVTPLGGFGCPNNPALTDDGVVGPTVALDDAGRGHVAWTAPCGNTDNGRHQLFRQVTQDGYSSTTRSVGKGDPEAFGPVGPQSAIDPATGRTRLVFTEAEFPAPIVFRDLQDDLPTGSQTTVVGSSSGNQPFAPRFGFLPDGRQVTAYRRNGPLWGTVTGGAETQLSPAGQTAVDPTLRVGRDGTVVVTWLGAGGYWAIVRDPIEETWGPAHQLSDDEGEPRELALGISDEGTAVAVWRRFTGEFVALEGAVRDPDDPTLSPGASKQFQPVPTVIYDFAASSSGTGGDVSVPRVAVTPAGEALVTLRVLQDLAPLRWGLFAARLRTPEPPPPPPPDPGPGAGGPGPGGGPGPSAGPGPVAGPSTPAPTAGPGDRRPPSLTAFTSTRLTFGRGTPFGRILAPRGKRTAANAAEIRTPLRAGTTLRWTADEAGTATIVLRHVGCWSLGYAGRGVTPSERCSRRPLDGVVARITARSTRGGNRLDYKATTTRGEKLRVGGTYRATLTIEDDAGNTSSSRTIPLRFDEALRR